MADSASIIPTPPTARSLSWSDNAAKLSYICIAFVRDRKNGSGHYCCYSLINYKHPFKRHARGRGHSRNDAAEYGNPITDKGKIVFFQCINIQVGKTKGKLVGINLIKDCIGDKKWLQIKFKTKWVRKFNEFRQGQLKQGVNSLRFYFVYNKRHLMQ